MKRLRMSVLASAVLRGWPLVIGMWAAVLAVTFIFAPNFEDVATFDDAAFLPADSPSVRGQKRIDELWPEAGLTRAVTIALVREAGPLTPDDVGYVDELVDWLDSPEAPEAVAGVTTHLRDEGLEDALTSDDSHAMLVVVELDAPGQSPAAEEAVNRLRAHLGDGSPPEGLGVYVTGDTAIEVDENQAVRDSVGRAQLLTVTLVVGLLAWVFRSAVAPLVPLVTVGTAYVVALGIVSALAQAGLAISYLFEMFAIVIAFGAGTDYSLLMMSRYGEELRLARGVGYALDASVRRRTLTATLVVLTAVVASSAASTMVGFWATSVAESGLFRNLGPALAITVAVTFIAGLTLTPALMRMAGRWLLWPHQAGRRATSEPDTPLINRSVVPASDPEEVSR